MIRRFLYRYRWWLLASLLVYAALTFWLFYLTDTPQTTPFEYQVF